MSLASVLRNQCTFPSRSLPDSITNLCITGHHAYCVQDLRMVVLTVHLFGNVLRAVWRVCYQHCKLRPRTATKQY